MHTRVWSSREVLLDSALRRLTRREQPIPAMISQMKSFIQHILERWFPTLAREIRFRAIRRVPLSNLIHHRLFEPELKLIPSLLQDPERLCLDIGAHVGEYCY